MEYINKELISIHKSIKRIFKDMQSGKVAYECDSMCGSPFMAMHDFVSYYEDEFEFFPATPETVRKYYEKMIQVRDAYSVKRMDTPIAKLKALMDENDI